MNDQVLKLHERLKFDLAAGQVVDGPRRYLIMRPDVLMGAFDGLEEPMRSQALQSLGRSVARFGSDSVRAYLREVGPQALLQAMVEGSASLGWGRWTFGEDEAGCWLEVTNSPFAAGTRYYEGRSCHAIAGMFQAVVEALLDAPAEVVEVRCACADHQPGVSCLFRAHKAQR
jgi:predicted hydrocarbon binding protein